MRALHRLLEREAGAQARRDPVLWIDFGYHAPPVGRLAQHELDELGARGEGRQPVAAARGLRQPRWIDGKVSKHCLRCSARRHQDEAVTPALADQHAMAMRASAEGM